VAGPLVLGAEGSFTSSITGKTTQLRVYTPQGYAAQVRQGAVVDLFEMQQPGAAELPLGAASCLLCCICIFLERKT
jgi:hypothetical protein